MSGDTGTPLDLLLAYGPLGVIVVLFIIGWIVPRRTVDQKDAEILRLQRLFEDEVMPMAKTYAETMQHTTGVMEQASRALTIQAALEERMRQQ